jgi:hypothetical protein
VTDWSGGRFGGPNPVGGPDQGGSGRWEPGAPTGPDRWAPQGSPSGPWEPTQQGPPPRFDQPPPGAPQGGPAGPWGAPPPGGAPGWQPPGAPGGPPPGPSGFGPPGWPPPRKSRKPLWITLGAGGAVIVVVAIVLAITLTGGAGHGGGGSAGDVVKGYLEALARGDAEKALSYSSDQPASKDFLSDDVLKKQIGQWPITNVRILNDDSAGSGATIGLSRVHVAANFGNTTSDATIDMKKDQGSWKLPSAAIKVQSNTITNDAAGKTLTFFDKPLGTSTAYVFPGFIEVGSTNPYLNVKIKPLLLDQLNLISEAFLQPEITLSDKGRDAARDQLVAAMGNCQKSNLLAPPGCPISLDPYGLADGTAAWGPGDVSGIKFDMFDQYRLQLLFNGEIKAPITVKTTGGGTKQGNASQFISGTADMAKTPPELSFR